MHRIDLLKFIIDIMKQTADSAQRLPIKPRPTRKTRAKNGERKPSVEERLIAATERLLDQGHSFGALTVEQLTSEAGMSRGTFYLHFRDKGELVARLMKVVTDEIVVSTGTWLANAEKADRSDIIAAVDGVAKTFRKHHAIVAAVSDMAPHDKNVAGLYEQMMDTIAQHCRRSMAIVKSKGKSRDAANNDVADALAWMILLYCTRFAGKQSDRNLKKITQSLGYICVSSIFADEA